MMTFLPYEDYEKSVKVLDNKRLGKQRVECLQLINILEGKQTSNGWKNHPALKMWVGHIDSLKFYCNCCIDEWVDRGFKNTMKKYDVNSNSEKPWWVGHENLHRSMRSRLIEKDKNFYLSKFPNDEGYNNGKYFWPIMETKTFRVI